MILVILALVLLLPSIPAPAAAEPYILPSPPQPDGVRIDIGLGIEPFVVCESWWRPYGGLSAFSLSPELAVPLLSYDLPAALGLERQPVFGAGPLMLEPYREGLAFNDAPVCDAFVNSLTIVGARWVRYSPKGRVEVTNAPPAATRKRSIVGVVEISGDSGPILYDAFLETRVTWDPLEPAWWLTAGRLPWELLSGLIQVGDSRFIQRDPPAIPIVGDPDGGGVTYAALAKATKTQSDLSGLVIDAQGNVSSDPSAPDMSYVSAPDSAAIEGGNLPHSIPTVFWDFLQQPGWVATDLSWVIVGYGRSWRPYFHYTLVQAPQRIPWLWLVGLPITEPYWTRAKVGGVERWILVQCFERRCLSYTPDNPDPWKVEFTNTGLHYYQWRYGEPWNPDQYRWTEADFAPRDTYRRVPQ